MSREKYSVLIVDDSALMRNVVGKIVESSDDLVIAGKAMNGKFALKKLRTIDPDVIVLDLEMPEMDGIEFLRERRKLDIRIPVVILSSVASRGAKITMEALALGASDFILKPSGSVADELRRVEKHLVSTLRAYAQKHRRNRTGSAADRPVAPPPPAPIKKEKLPRPVEAIAIGISTGGPNALRRVFHEVDASIPAPIFVVQHMPAGFTAEFAGSLDRLSGLEIKEAESGDVARAGRVYVAPGNKHMTVTKKRLATVIELDDNEPVNGHRPSADVLFSSIARTYGGDSMAIIMTGMGRDGARSIGEIQSAGGHTVGQDEDTCVVYGMPRIAAQNGFIDVVLPLECIADYINRVALRQRS